ncbi:MAG: hypothetical protein ABI988_18735, partial [Nitrospirota bacterium]
SVLAGDTIEILYNSHPERIRLNGIACPEKDTDNLRAYCSRPEVWPGFMSMIGTHSWDWDNRQRVILIIHLRHDTISLLDLSHHLGNVI